MSHKVICINRLCGSGGHIIGKMVADELGIGYYDHNLLDMALEYGDLHDSKGIKSFLRADERATNKAFYRLRCEGNENVEKEKPATATIFQLQRDLILNFTQEEDCVIIGRCADYILESADVSMLSVFVTAPKDFRVSHIMTSDNLTKSRAERHVGQTDKRRKDYFYCFTKQDWMDPQIYDMILNSDKLGYDKCTKLLCDCYHDLL